MDRIRGLLGVGVEYEPLRSGESGGDSGEDGVRGARVLWDRDADRGGRTTVTTTFSWLEYGVFLLLGVAMLWSWNMFLAASTYFATRFSSSPALLSNFQPAEIFVSTLLNLLSMLLLSHLQYPPRFISYPSRILIALAINMFVFTLLALSTDQNAWSLSTASYFAFFIFCVAASSLGTGLCQNGVFAYVGGFGMEEYTQALMTGQAVAGVLPCVAQIVSVLGVSGKESAEEESGEGKGKTSSPEMASSAFAYFLTATGVSAVTFVAFFYLLARHGRSSQYSRKSTAVADITAGATTETSPIRNEDEDAYDPSSSSIANSTEALRVKPAKNFVPLTRLFRKLFWLALGVFATFAVTMVYPVFTQVIQSTHPETADRPAILSPAAFVPLAFLIWNSGDLLGRLAAGVHALSLTRRPRLVFLLAICRIIFVPLYLLCNIPRPSGPGAEEGSAATYAAAVQSDVFYLVVVQLLFGLSNGFLGSTCMMGANEWVDIEEREAAGGFMGLCLVAGLTAGSLCSFGVSAIWLS